MDGQEKKQYDFLSGALVFGPDSSRLAYGAEMDRKKFVVVDETEGYRYDSIANDVWIFDSPNHLHYMAKKGNAFYLVEEEFK